MRKADNMSESDLRTAARNMGDYGGGFAQAMSLAYMLADATNKVRVVNAFPELFERYAPRQGWEK